MLPTYLQFCFQAQAPDERVGDVVMPLKAQCTPLLHTAQKGYIDYSKQNVRLYYYYYYLIYEKRFKNSTNQFGTLPGIGVPVALGHVLW